MNPNKGIDRMKLQTVEELMAQPGMDPDPTKRSEPDLDVETEEEDHDAGATPDDDEPVYADDIMALFDENHGLTAEGYALLAKMDAMGDFV